MSAFRVHEWGAAPRFDRVPVPIPGAGETLVRVEAAAVTHLDHTIAGGEFVIRPALPYVGGIEGAGTVVSSRSFPDGVRVTIRGGDVGAGRDGTWAEYVVVPDDALNIAPEGLTPSLAATAFDPLTTAYAALYDVGRLGDWPAVKATTASDEVVVVLGAAGAVGSATVQLALIAGAEVIGVVSRRERAAQVPHGAQIVTLEDEAKLAELERERPATLVVDTWGGERLTARAAWSRAGGRTTVIGYVHGPAVTLDIANWMFDDVAVLPVNMIRRRADAERTASALLDLLVTQQVRLEVTEHPMVADTPVFDLLAAGKVSGRAVLVP